MNAWVYCSDSSWNSSWSAVCTPSAAASSPPPKQKKRDLLNDPPSAACTLQPAIHCCFSSGVGGAGSSGALARPSAKWSHRVFSYWPS